MSDQKDPKQEFQERLAIEKRRQEVQDKKLVIEERRTKLEMERIAKAEHDLEIAKNTSFGALSPEEIERLRQVNRDYFEAAKTQMTFVCDTFTGIIPYFRKNVILIGAKTGEGKSTTVANVAFETVKQRCPDGSRRRVLVITNEEKAEDVYNRVTCLAKGWAYTNHDKFTPEQIETLDEWMVKLTASGTMTVIDNDFKGGIGMSTSIEGLCTIFDNLIREQEFYDVVLIDYYQNFKYSKNNIHLNEYEVQAQVANALDKYKNIYPAPIVIMSQVNPPDEAGTPFQYRIKGRKIIMDIATCVVEMVAERDHFRTQWTIHKSRFNESVGNSFHTGFQRGRYVPYTKEFVTEVARLKEARMMRNAGVNVPMPEDLAAGKALKEKMENNK